MMPNPLIGTAVAFRSGCPGRVADSVSVDAIAENSHCRPDRIWHYIFKG